MFLVISAQNDYYDIYGIKIFTLHGRGGKSERCRFSETEKKAEKRGCRRPEKPLETPSIRRLRKHIEKAITTCKQAVFVAIKKPSREFSLTAFL